MKKDYTPDSVGDFLKDFPEYKDFSVEYIVKGVSTEVYRLMHSDTILYFRIAREGNNMSSEALALSLLKEKGVKVPVVLTHEDYNKKLGRSYMITSEIKGKPITDKEENIDTILHETGKQIALANSIPVKNFGWMERESANCLELTGECPTYEDFYLNDERITAMAKHLTDEGILESSIIEKYFHYYYKKKSSFVCNQAFLAHGDFSIDHIYQSHGKYSGIIDWGDIRATSVYHDLGHFYIYSPPLFDRVLKGYLSVNKLEDDYMDNIEFVAMLIAIGKLWWLSKYLPKALEKKKHPAIVLIEKVLL